MALTFEGKYSGIDSNQNSYFTFSGAPGSSGSPVVDNDMKIVSVIHSAHLHFSGLSIGCTHKNLVRFLYKNRKFIEFLNYFDDSLE